MTKTNDKLAAENERRRVLQRQYNTVKELANGNNRALLEWMTQQARQAGMSYGQFVIWLRR